MGRTNTLFYSDGNRLPFDLEKCVGRIVHYFSLKILAHLQKQYFLVENLVVILKCAVIRTKYNLIE